MTVITVMHNLVLTEMRVVSFDIVVLAVRVVVMLFVIIIVVVIIVYDGIGSSRA